MFAASPCARVDRLPRTPQTVYRERNNHRCAWTVGGLDEERFTLRFPFSWRKQRLFDRYVDIQRRLKVKRKIPNGIAPHNGSQWPAHTTHTSILEDPDRADYDRYFSKVWIPDESYFQTLCRLYSSDVQSRSLTLSKFDHQGKPYIFYDDHLQLLRRSDCFVARKIWPRADRLYAGFLTDAEHAMKKAEPDPGKIDPCFHVRSTCACAVARLYMQSRFPDGEWNEVVTSAP